jgi:serine/threonine protein kinase/TolA-binding protein
MIPTEAVPLNAEVKPGGFGKYLLLEKIGEGVMAQLHRATTTDVHGAEKILAIKRILPHLSGERDLAKAFLDEAKLTALLNHENIVRIYDSGQVKSSYFIAMEYLSGKDLKQIFDESREKGLPFGFEDALFITSQICSGLDYAHKLTDSQGEPLHILHRDISPQNILITHEGRVKIVDFGIVRAASKCTVTKHEMLKKKVAYLSPEQALGEKIDPCSDIFCTGILLYEMVTNKKMYNGATMQVLAKVRKAEFEPPEAAMSGLPPKLYRILDKALAKEKDQRYQSCGEMLADIEECISELPSRPTAQGLAEYIKELFGGKVEAEGDSNKPAKVDPKPMTPRLMIPDPVGPAPDPVSPQPVRLDPAHSDPVHFDPAGPKWPSPNPVSPSSDLVNPHPIGPDPPHSGPVHLELDRIYGVSPKSLLLDPAGPDEAGPKPIDLDPETALGDDLKFVEDILRKAKETVEEEDALKRRNRWIYLSALVVFLGVVVLGWAFWPKEKPVSSPSREALKSAPSSEPSKETAPVTTTLSNGPPKQETISDRYAEAKALQDKAVPLAEKNPKEALSLFLKVIELDPQNVQGHFQLGLTYMALKNSSKAMEAYQKVTELDPRFVDAYFNLGYIYATDKNYSKAEQMYTQVVKLAPPYLDEALFNLSLVQEKQGKREQCLENIKRALQANPKNQMAQKFLERLKHDS